MQKLTDININQKLLDTKDSRLELIIKGKNINFSVISALRRTCISDVPIYSFNEIHFDSNSSIYNNDYLRTRIQSFPVRSIKNDIIFYDDTIEPENTEDNNAYTTENVLLEENVKIAIGEDDIIMSDTEELSEKDNYNMLTMYVDIQNNDNKIIQVTTDNCKFYQNGSEINNIYKKPLLICKLKNEQKISLTAIVNLGIERTSTLYSPVSICTYSEINENEYKFILESRGQINEYRILYVACMNILRRLEYLSELIPDDNKHLEGELNIDKMGHTMGNLLSNGLLLHDDVIYAGYSKPHLLDDKIIIKFKLKKSNIHSILNDIITLYKKLYESLAKQFNK